MDAFEWNPASYLDLMAEEVPQYERLQDELVRACDDLSPSTILELGSGSGETARRLAAAHPGAALTGIDASAAMLGAAREAVPQAVFREGRLEDPLPDGPWSLVVSALAVHHIDGRAKRDLTARVAAALEPGGRYVVADIVVPADPSDVEVPLGDDEFPSSAEDQLGWMEGAGLRARISWEHRDMAVMVGESRA